MAINHNKMLISRDQWVRIWTTVPAARVRAIAAELKARYTINDVELAQSGLGLLPLSDSALGEAYFLGEIPLARAHVRISDGKGVQVEGAATLVDDRASLAHALAIMDGVLSARLPGYESTLELLTEGAANISKTDGDRRKLLAATRVDFALLSTADEENDNA